MSWLGDVMHVIERMVTLEERLSDINDRLLKVTLKYDELSQRVARIEGKFETLESYGLMRSRRKQTPS